MATDDTTTPVNPILAAFAEAMRKKLAAKAKTDQAKERAHEQRTNLRIGHRAKLHRLKQAGALASLADLLLLSGDQRDRHVQAVRSWLESLPSKQGLLLSDGPFTLAPADVAALVVACGASERDCFSMALAVGEPSTEGGGRLAMIARSFSIGGEDK